MGKGGLYAEKYGTLFLHSMCHFFKDLHLLPVVVELICARRAGGFCLSRFFASVPHRLATVGPPHKSSK